MFGVILFGFLLQCTHSDENTSNGTTQFLIDGKRFEINNAGIVNFGGGANYNGHRTVLLFTTKGISFGKYANKNLVLKGKGALFGVVIYLPNPLQLDEVKYFVNLRPPHKHYDIGVGFYTLDFDENVYSPPFLRNPNGKFKGYPYRNQIEGNQLQGYSDHFPVYVVLGKNP